jgi:hypothetical protein
VAENRFGAVDAELRADVVRRLNEGVDRSRLIDELVGRGFERSEAEAFVDSLLEAATREVLQPGDLVRAVIGGVLAAILAGLAWGVLTEATSTEWGIAATGVGLLVGFGVVVLARGKRGVPLQVIAAGAAVIGVAFGKYVTFVQAGQSFFEERIGPGAGHAVQIFDGQTFSFFLDSLGQLFTGWDLAWAAFAVYAAWRIPRGLGFRKRPAPTPFG